MNRVIRPSGLTTASTIRGDLYTPRRSQPEGIPLQGHAFLNTVSAVKRVFKKPQRRVALPPPLISLLICLLTACPAAASDDRLSGFTASVGAWYASWLADSPLNLPTNTLSYYTVTYNIKAALLKEGEASLGFGRLALGAHLAGDADQLSDVMKKRGSVFQFGCTTLLSVADGDLNIEGRYLTGRFRGTASASTALERDGIPSGLPLSLRWSTEYQAASLMARINDDESLQQLPFCPREAGIGIGYTKYAMPTTVFTAQFGSGVVATSRALVSTNISLYYLASYLEYCSSSRRNASGLYLNTRNSFGVCRFDARSSDVDAFGACVINESELGAELRNRWLSIRLGGRLSVHYATANSQAGVTDSFGRPLDGNSIALACTNLFYGGLCCVGLTL